MTRGITSGATAAYGHVRQAFDAPELVHGLGRVGIAPGAQAKEHAALAQGAARQSKIHHKGAWPLCGGNDVCPDKTCQNKPVPFWQVLGQMVLDEVADGSGVVDVDGSGREAGVEGLTRQGFVAGKG